MCISTPSASQYTTVVRFIVFFVVFSDQSQTIYPSPSDLFPETQDYGKFRLSVMLLSIIDTVRTRQQRSEEIEN